LYPDKKKNWKNPGLIPGSAAGVNGIGSYNDIYLEIPVDQRFTVHNSDRDQKPDSDPSKT